MDHDEALDQAINVLAKLGADAKRVVEGSERTADLLGTDKSGANYCIEVKTKAHSEEFWQGVCSDLQDGEIAVTEETLHRTEAVADVLKYACKQLAATVTSDDAFRIIWVSFDGHDQDLRWNQVLATFYGIKYVSPRGLRSPKSNADYCYYFDYSVAHSHSNIDALAICDGDNFQFCLNEFSPRYALLKATRFHALLQELGAILDPTALVRDGIAIALRSTISRSDKAIVEAALSEQEGADYISFDLNRHAVHASVYHKE